MVGLAVGLAILVCDKPVAGDQVYEAAPVACNVVLLPIHIDLSVPAFTTGSEFTVTDTVAVSLQLFAAVPITEYIVVAEG